MSTRRTFVRRVSIGRPISNVNEAASGVVSAQARAAGNILINSASTNLYQSGDIQGSHGITKYFDSTGNNIVLSVDSDDLKSVIDSAYVKFITGQSTSRNFVDSAYVEQNSLDSERGTAHINDVLRDLTVSIIPNADSSVDLGSASKKFRKLFLSGSTIELGTLSISDSDGNLVVRDNSNNKTKLDLSANSTNDLKESDNLYYTRARFDSALGDTTSRGTIRGYINLVDAGGDGSLTYDSALGKLTYTGPSAAEVRAHLNGGHGIVYSTSTGNISVDSSEVRGLFSAGGDLTYNSSTGEFTFDVENVYTQANFESDLSLSLNATNGIAYDSASHKLSLINTGVDSGTYGSSTRVPILRIQSDGRVDSAGSVLVAGVTGVSFDSATETITISTADGNTFSTAIGGYDNLEATNFTADSAVVTDISGSSINYDSGSVNEFTATNITADSAVITDISGTTANYPTIISSQLSADSASITTIDNNVLRTNDLNADSAVITDVSGTTLNYTQAHLDSAVAVDISGTTLNYSQAHLDSARALDISGNTLTYVSGHIGELDIDSAQTGNLRVSGNLTVAGETVTITASTLTVNDPLIHLADSNEFSDVVDIGFIGHYYRDAQRRHTGLFRDASNDQYYLFRNMIDSAFDSAVPPSVINRSATDFTKADLNVGNLIADSATMTNLDATGTVIAHTVAVTGILSRPVTVDSGTYGSSTLIPQITVDTSGFIDSIGTVAVAGVSGTAWDSSTGEYTISTADGGSFATAIRGFNDNISLAFGNDDDAIITRNPTNLVIKDSTGGIYLEAQDIYLASKNNGNPIWLQVGADDGVKLNDSTGNLILKTRKYGVELNGSITGDSADFDIIRIGGKVIPSHVDSAYIESVTLDSERTISLIDSNYLAEKVKNLEGDITITTVNDGAGVGPSLTLQRDTANAADSDLLGSLVFSGKDSGGSTQEYAKIVAVIDDATTGAEDGAIETSVFDDGSYIKSTRLSKTGFEILNQIPLSLTGQLILNNEVVDSNYVGERARVITSSEIKYIDVDAGAGLGPRIVLDRNSSSPADSDALGYLEFRGRNSSDSDMEYASIRAFTQDVTKDTEDGELQFHLKQAGFDREKFALTPRGFELGTNERLYFQGDSGDLYLHSDPTSSHNLLLPDSSGTLLTRDFVFNLIDSAYVGDRVTSTGLTLPINDSAGDQLIALTIVQAATITTGAPIGFGNSITVLDTDSAEVTISL